MPNPYQIVRDFEQAVCEYTGAPYCVSVNSCTMAILLAVKWCLRDDPVLRLREVEIPRRTYVSVPMSIMHAGGRPTFRDEDWHGQYQLKPLPVWDSARMFTSGMYIGRMLTKINPVLPPMLDCSGHMLCVSFHASKILGDTQGGAILHDNKEADAWFRRMRFDGRTEGIAPKDDHFREIGYHCYLSSDVAARLLLKLHSLPKHNDPLPNDDYPDLSTMEIFR